MRTLTLTLAEFLLARIAEDEAIGGCGGPDAGCIGLSDQLFRECEAKRRIVEAAIAHRKRSKKAWREYSRWAQGKPVLEPGTPMHASDTDVTEAHDAVLRVLASVWSDHPDFREDWP